MVEYKGESTDAGKGAVKTYQCVGRVTAEHYYFRSVIFWQLGQLHKSYEQSEWRSYNVPEHESHLWVCKEVTSQIEQYLGGHHKVWSVWLRGDQLANYAVTHQAQCHVE